jgi:hypothetical protein
MNADDSTSSIFIRAHALTQILTSSRLSSVIKISITRLRLVTYAYYEGNFAEY